MHLLFFLLAITTLCFACPQNCLFCLQEPTCTACMKGYIITLDATCLTQTVSNCRVQLNSTFCSICEPTFQVNSGQCIKDYSGCVVRNSAGACQYCWFGTKLNGNVCTGVMNCQITLATGQCSQCFIGYSLTAGVCT
jgi:hypothetical protein